MPLAPRLLDDRPLVASIAGISPPTLDLFDGKFDRLNRMAASPGVAASSLLDDRSDFNGKLDVGNWENEGSIDPINSFSDFGLLEASSSNQIFDRALTSRSENLATVQRDKLTGMDFPVGDSSRNIERSQSQIPALFPAENWTFDFKDYTIDHQGLNTLNIKVGYGFKPGITSTEYPDFVPIYRSIDNFLVNYPNETDFWEILNTNLTQKVLDENPVFEDVTIQIEVLPTNRLPYDRSSTVFRSRSGQLQEAWNFSLQNYAIEHQGLNKLNLDVNYQYKPGITREEYPDFVPIFQRIDNFLTNYPNETDFWEVVNRNLTKTLLDENPALGAINIDFNVLPSTQLPYNRTSKVTRTQPSNREGTFLIGNTRGNNILRFDGKTGNFLGEFVTAGSGGLVAPDTIIFGPDGNGDGNSDIYVASGDKAGNSRENGASAILRYDGITGEFIDRFVGDNPNTQTDETGGLFRPYGLAFSPDGNLYASSFLSDKILRYDGKTGQFLDVFASGNQQAGGLNGPNGLLFAPDGFLYVTTQGSVARNDRADFSDNFPSQVLRYNPVSKEFSIFASPDPSPRSFGFASLLGMAIGPVDGDLYVSDFANDIRRYNLKSGELIEVLPTNYTGTSPSSNFIGSLAFSPIGNLFAVGFDNRANAGNAGAVLRFNGATGDPLPATGKENAIFVSPDSKLQRPIGIAFFPNDAKLVEKWNFTAANYPIDHQGLNNLNLDVNYKYREGIQNFQYPDFVPIYKAIDSYLANYPNETDFWEIVNKNLTEKVLSENPALSSVTVKLDVLPTNRLPYDRASTVTRTAGGKLGESWNFQFANYSIDHQGLNNLNIDVSYQYKQGITPAEYPDFVPIYNSIDKFLTDYPNETDFWEIVNKNLTQKVLAENPVLDALQIDIAVLPTPRLPYDRASIVSIA
jgi:sugar lactone lactonase YvrE